MTKLARSLLVVAALLAPAVAFAQNNVAARVGPGVQMNCGTAVPTGVATRGILWCKSSDTNKLHYLPPGGSDAAVGGSSITWPLTNGTSTLTYSFGGTDGGSAVAHRFTAGVGFATDGDLLLRLDANGTDWLTIGRLASQNAFTFKGNANATGAGPVFVTATSGAAGVTLDATAGGGRKYTLYSTTTGLLTLADLTASANRWAMDSNGAWYPFNDGANNLGLPGNRPAAVYTSSIVLPQIAATSGAPNGILFTGAAHTGLTASTEVPDVDVNLNRTVQWATGALATQRGFVIRAPTYAFVGSSTLTTAATLSVTGAPTAGTNATITNRYTINAESGDVILSGSGARLIAQHLAGRGTGPSIGVGAAAQLGTSPSAAVVSNSTDTSGTLSITTGTTPSALSANTAITGATVTFGGSYPTVAPKGIVLTPSNSAAAAISTGSAGIVFFVDQASTSTTQFLIKIVAPTAATLGASTAYQFAYHVIQ